MQSTDESGGEQPLSSGSEVHASHEGHPEVKPGSAKASWIFGGGLLVMLCLVIFVLPEPTQSQRDILRFVMGVDAGLLAYFVLGSVSLSGTIQGQQVRAGGGFVVWILIQFVVNPFSVRTEVATVAPGLSPKDSSIQKAQENLKILGLYKNDVNGLGDEATRSAVIVFQKAHGLPVDGFVGPATQGKLREAVKQFQKEDGLIQDGYLGPKTRAEMLKRQAGSSSKPDE